MPMPRLAIFALDRRVASLPRFARWARRCRRQMPRADEAPLHERIDALVEAAAPGPVAAIASDADFLRRAYLDLDGTIPDAATARAFLDDPAPDKRAGAGRSAAGRPQFARQMQFVFDVMLMERRPQKNLPAAEWNVSAAEWQEYLCKSFADNKPLDQLVREILAPTASIRSCGRRPSSISIATATPTC